MPDRQLQALHPRRAGIAAALERAIPLPTFDAEARLETHRLDRIDRNERQAR